jgi:Regulator of chromosome condensation (RCC1) repeat/Subtilase family/IPT/TIG domain
MGRDLVISGGAARAHGSAGAGVRGRARVAAAVIAGLSSLALALLATFAIAPAHAASAREEALVRGPGGVRASLSRGGGVPFATPARGAPAGAGASGEGEAGEPISRTPSKVKPYYVCPDGPCLAIVDPEPVARKVRGRRRLALPDGKLLEGSGEKGGYDPQDLQSAYDIPTTGGAGETIAIVDAYGFKEAESSLAVYRERYGLPPCTTADGCFRKVNEKGQEGNYPVENGWQGEQALDIEMVSAACPECHILLVQASTASEEALGTAENTAVRLGAVEVSNSWSSPEQTCKVSNCEQFEKQYYDHPDVMLFFAGGDNAYDNTYLGAHSPDYPASLPSTIAVGGTALHRAENERGWSEETWYEPSRKAGGGSGCSRFHKPSWQSDSGCAGRMTVDVSADAACETPVSVYDSGRWALICGTSASSPLVAGIEAHAESYVRTLPGAEAFYEASSGLRDVTAGINGKCSAEPAVAYFCRAEPGYDGPTGLGSPDGPISLAPAAPQATTRPPSGLAGGHATLQGYVSPRGLPTTYRFEYGTSTEYGTSVPVPDGSVEGFGQQVSATIGELQADTVYHYRLLATNADGTSYGADYAFSTGAPVISGVSPQLGPAHGGLAVKITGENLLAATSVDFGAREAGEFTVESNESITAQLPPGTGAVAVTVTTPAGASTSEGEADSFAYSPPGPVLAWGENFGDLGNGESGESEVPVEVSGLQEAQALTSGWGQSLALMNDGTLRAWGENEFGVVGDGTFERRSTPVRVCALEVSSCPEGPYLEGVTQVSAGRLPTLALLADGTVAAWGGNLYGDLATDTERNPYPLPVCTQLETPCKPENHLREVVEVAAGADFSLARLANGTVLAWGENTHGQLGDGTSSGPEACGEGKEACSRVPVPVHGLSEVVAIAAGTFQGLALLKDGTVMAWGGGQNGQLGDGADADATTPRPVCAIGQGKACNPLEGVRAISAAAWDSYALLNNGTVAAWGYAGEGQLGDGATNGPQTCKEEKFKFACSTAPVLVSGLTGVRALAQGERAWSALVELESGQLDTWGAGRWGALGDGSASNSDVPVGVCAPYAYGACPHGPYLHGQVTALAAGSHDLLAMRPSAAPLVSSLLPASGPAAGGTRVRIVGANLLEATAVDFGAAAASEYEVRSDDEIVAVSPPGSGTVAVTVTTPQGTSSTEAEDEYTYEGPPVVLTGAATHVEANAATLTATVDPQGQNVSECRFEYGTTPAYGQSVPCTPAPGAGVRPVAVSAALTGLAGGGTYYYRAVAVNAEGTGYGAQQSFSTQHLPEVGRCVKSSSAHARYSDKACTSLSSGGDSGKYEWLALADAGFTASFTSLSLETAPAARETHGHALLTCNAGAASGQYTGWQTATVSLTLTDCTMQVFGPVPCRSSEAAAGEIKIAALPVRLGFISAGAKPSVGWMLGASGSPIASFECEGFPESLTGAVIGALHTADKMSASNALTFKGREGAQTPSSFEGGNEVALTLAGARSGKVSLATSATVAGAEASEFRAVE